MNQTYIFTSERLGFRNWINEDIAKMKDLCSDPEVMEFFPPIKDPHYAANFVRRMQVQFSQTRYCFFAVDKYQTGEFLGFIGLSEIKYEAEFTPGTEIGWRLKKECWNQGFATEGAKRCLQYAFDDLNLRCIYSIAPYINKKSEYIMKKIGLAKVRNFIHPLLLNHEALKKCVLYKKDNSQLDDS